MRTAHYVEGPVWLVRLSQTGPLHFSKVHSSCTKLRCTCHLCLIWFWQGDSGWAVRCRWCCSHLWSGSRTDSLSRRPQTMSRTRIFRKPRGTSKVSPRKSASSRTAAHSSQELLTSSRSLYSKRLVLSNKPTGLLGRRGLLYADKRLMMVI